MFPPLSPALDKLWENCIYPERIGDDADTDRERETSWQTDLDEFNELRVLRAVEEFTIEIRTFTSSLLRSTHKHPHLYHHHHHHYHHCYHSDIRTFTSSLLHSTHKHPHLHHHHHHWNHLAIINTDCSAYTFYLFKSALQCIAHNVSALCCLQTTLQSINLLLPLVNCFENEKKTANNFAENNEKLWGSARKMC